ncbi:MAG: type II toxin-antitoxin system mRNA interferase toxin, RelE/StbE family [Epsilonproteobacteria bacterium]|nr:MAG: type II toxin-antitoxin system mRNA interferase toxin, RelE/StbE family [Campylobacterota bacterium]
MPLRLQRHKLFKKDIAKVKITDTQYSKFIIYIALLLKGEELPEESRDHLLKGEWQGYREFHLGGDLLLVYVIKDDSLILIRIGTHSQLFK